MQQVGIIAMVDTYCNDRPIKVYRLQAKVLIHIKKCMLSLGYFARMDFSRQNHMEGIS